MSMRIAVAVHAPASEDLHIALVRLAERCDVVAMRDGGPFDAVVRSDGDRGEPGERTLRWVESVDGPPHPAFAYLATPAKARTLRRAGHDVIALGPPDRFTGAVPIAPFTRARIRRARGIAAAAVLRESSGTLSWDGRPVPTGSEATAFALCSVAIVETADMALHGAAWQAPVVAPADVCTSTGLPSFEDASGSDGAVADLLGDMETQARHALACRRAFELDSSPAWSVRRLELLLKIPAAAPWESDYSLELARLGTSGGAPIRGRAAEAVAALRSPR